MPITFHIPGPLRPFTDGCTQVEIEARHANLGDALEALWALHPGIRDRIVTEQGEVRQHVNVFVGNECIRYTRGLATLVPDGVEVFIVPAVSGGWEISPIRRRSTGSRFDFRSPS